jgi:hypothetical protein
MSRDYLESHIHHLALVEVQALAEQLYRLQAHLRLFAYETPENVEAHRDDVGGFHGLHVRSLALSSRKRCLSKHLSGVELSFKEAYKVTGREKEPATCGPVLCDLLPLL